jgi:hypothetical protein
LEKKVGLGWYHIYSSLHDSKGQTSDKEASMFYVSFLCTTGLLSVPSDQLSKCVCKPQLTSFLTFLHKDNAFVSQNEEAQRFSGGRD